jgi:hypothetical protein
MAWDFGAQIHTLTGFDADSSSASEEGTETYQVLATQWLTDAAKEVINILPPELKMECATITSLTSSTPMDLDATGKVLHVTRENADSGYHIGCRKVNAILAGSADDSTSLHYVTATDPIYWTESDTGGDPKLFVKPTPTANQPARVHHVAFPAVAYDATAIVNFPDEAEYLVVLRAAITAAEYKLNFEEDAELYIPIISSLKAQYQEGVQGLVSGNISQQQPQQGAR